MSTAYMAVCPASGIMYNAVNAEEYGEIQENGFKNVSDAPLSTFSIDVDAASYSNMRRFINKGKLPSVRYGQDGDLRSKGRFRLPS